MTRYTRSQIGLRAARGGPGDLDPREVLGIALHWPAMVKPLTTVDSVKGALRSWQSYHMDTHGWSDIAYQEAIDQAGNVYRLRGFGFKAAGEMSGANGDRTVNEEYGALLLVLAPGEHPTKHLLTSAQRRIAAFRLLYPKGVRIRGHNEIRPEPTSCPGPIVSDLIKAGAFNPSHLTT